MQSEFVKEGKNLPPEDAFFAYTRLTDQLLHFLIQQSKREFFYWKGLGAFFLLGMIFYILHGHGFAFSPFFSVVFIGIAALFLLAQNMKQDFEYGRGVAACIEQGRLLEKKFEYPVQLFKIFEDNKRVTYRANLLSRLCPLGIIGTAIAGAGTLLAISVGVWFAFIVAILAAAILYTAARSYIKTARRILLGG